MFVVLGATGNVGGKLACQLLDAGARVRVVARSADALAPLVARGAEACVGSIGDRDFLRGAFTGADGAFVLIPPLPNVATDLTKLQDALGEQIALALSDAKVRNVVHLSSVGAHLPARSGIILALNHQENRLLSLLGAANVVHLRCGNFFENAMAWIGMVKHAGLIGGAIRGDVPCPTIGTRDVADMAWRYLAGGFTGHSVHYLLGPRDLTFDEMALIVGRALGRELRYHALAYDAAEAALVRAGLGAASAAGIVELGRAINEGLVYEPQKRNWSSTTPYRFEQFVDELFVPVFNH